MKIVWPETRSRSTYCDPVLDTGDTHLKPHQVGVIASGGKYSVSYRWVVGEKVIATSVELHGDISRHPHRNQYLGVSQAESTPMSEKALARPKNYRIHQPSIGLDDDIARIRELHRKASGLVVN